MLRAGSGRVPGARRPAASRPLLPAAARPAAAALLAACVAVAILLGALFWHQAHAGWLDRAVDTRLEASLGGHRVILNLLVGLGDPLPVTVIVVVLLLACAAARRWRGALLLAVAVPSAAALTELALKPLVGRLLGGGLSFPSGHATGMFALAAAIGVLLLGPPRPRRPAVLRVVLGLCAYAAAGAVAVALVSLHLHYFTDTVAGAAVGTAVVLATAFLLDWLCARREPAPAPPGRLTSVPEPAPHQARGGGRGQLP
ncbi:MAG: phosphatase PAP2 family protein [Streptosporangiaceae bacterium]